MVERAENWLSELLEKHGLDEQGVREVTSQIIEEETESLKETLPDKPSSVLEEQEWATFAMCERIDELLEKEVDSTILLSALQTAMVYALEQMGEDDNDEDGE